MSHTTNKNHLDSTNLDNPLTSLRLNSDLSAGTKGYVLAMFLCEHGDLTFPSMVAGWEGWGWRTKGGIYWECVACCWIGECPMNADHIYALLDQSWWTSELEAHKEQIVKDILRIAQGLKDTEVELQSVASIEVSTEKKNSL